MKGVPQFNEASISAEGKKFAIIVSQFNHAITQKLLDGALDSFRKHNADMEHDIDVFYCPGAFELPQTASFVSLRKKYDAIVCLGAVIQGETPHFDYICQECSRGIGQVAIERGVPILFGVLTTHTYEQAIERSGGSFGNKGFDAALGAISMAHLYSSILTEQ